MLGENDGTGIYETFDIAELEVWGQDPDGVPPPPPASCR
jgi:hypothetical protein